MINKTDYEVHITFYYNEILEYLLYSSWTRIFGEKSKNLNLMQSTKNSMLKRDVQQEVLLPPCDLQSGETLKPDLSQI